MKTPSHKRQSLGHNEEKLTFLQFVTPPIIYVCCVHVGGRRERERERESERERAHNSVG